MRLFIGIPPDRNALMALAETARRMQKAAAGRYVDASLYHLTLAFLGDVDDALAPTAALAMKSAAASFAPFQTVLGGVGTFGPILWRGVADNTALNRLSGRVRAALDAAGVWYDKKPFAAHITLARDLHLPANVREVEIPGAAFFVRSLILYESARTGGRLAYRPLAEASLQ